MLVKEWSNNLGYKYSKYRRLLVYGPPGAGKTRLAGTFPDPFLIDTDRGLATLDKEGLLPPDHRILELRKDDECFEIIMDILIRLRDNKEPFQNDRPKSLIIDSVSQLASFLMMKFMENPSRAKNSKLSSRDPAYQKPVYDHWGVLLNQMKIIFDTTKDINCHVAATSGVKVEYDQDGNRIGGLPYVDGRYKEIIGHCFDDFLYMEVTGSGRNLHYEAHAVHYKGNSAKTRGVLPEKLENPTFQTLYGDWLKKHEQAAETER